MSVKKKFKSMADEWRALYASPLDDDSTLVCESCGAVILGDAPDFHLLCFTCYKKASLKERLELWGDEAHPELTHERRRPA